ncbi:MAG TPA: hypothetical protein PLY88_04945 [Candidatus Omnitrophota bacterium]|nr:hypothetical protein [Candidatus Omnitrophota bacterium]
MKLSFRFLMLGGLLYVLFCGFQFHPSAIVPEVSLKQSDRTGFFFPKVKSSASRMIVADTEHQPLESVLSLLASASLFSRSA